MNLLIELGMLVLVASIVIFFSREFGQWIKKFFSIPGTMLLVPMILLSWFVIYFQKNIWVIAQFLHEKLQSFIQFLASFLPFSWQKESIISILFLSAATVLPVYLIQHLYWRRTLLPFKYGYLISTIIWIILATLLMMKN